MCVVFEFEISFCICTWWSVKSKRVHVWHQEPGAACQAVGGEEGDYAACTEV